MSHTYVGMISFVITGEDDNEALRRDRNKYEAFESSTSPYCWGGGQISVRASGVHDLRHDILRAEYEGRI